MKKDRPNFGDDYFAPTNRLIYGEQHRRGFSEQFDSRYAKSRLDLGVPATLPASFPGNINIFGVDGGGVWHVFHKPGGSRILFNTFLSAPTYPAWPDATSRLWSFDGDTLVSPEDGVEIMDTPAFSYGHRMDCNSKGEVVVLDIDAPYTKIFLAYSKDWGLTWERAVASWDILNDGWACYYALAIDEEGYVYVAMADPFDAGYNSPPGIGYLIYRSNCPMSQGDVSFNLLWSHPQFSIGLPPYVDPLDPSPVAISAYDAGDSMTLSVTGSGANAKWAFVVDGWEGMYQVVDGAKTNLGGSQWDDKMPGGGINEFYYTHPAICRSDTTVIVFTEVIRTEYAYREAQWDDQIQPNTWRVTCPFTGTDLVWGYTEISGYVSQGWLDWPFDSTINAAGYATNYGEFAGGLVRFSRDLPSKFHLLRNGVVAHELGGDTRRIIELEQASDQFCVSYDRLNPNIWVATASALSPGVDQTHGAPLGYLISYDDGVTWEEQAVDGSAAYRIWGNVMGQSTGGHMASIDIYEGELAFAYTYWHFPRAGVMDSGISVFHGYVSGNGVSWDKIYDEAILGILLGDDAQVTAVKIRRG